MDYDPVNYFLMKLNGWDEMEENRIEYKVSECHSKVKYCLMITLFYVYVCVCISPCVLG